MGTIFVDNIKNNVGGKKLNIGDSSINVDDDGTVTINEGSVDADFRVESNASTHAIFVNGGDERVSIFQSGTLNAAGDNTDDGLTVYNDGRVDISRASGQPLNLRRRTDNGNLLAFYKETSGSTANVGAVNLRGAEFIAVGSGDTNLEYNFGSDQINPSSGSAVRDNAIDLGTSSARFDDIHATNGTIQTSDQNEKQDIASATAKELNVAKKLSTLFKTFRWKDKVTEKGDKARTHTGIIAQEVQSAFSAEGLDASNYGLFTSDTWTNDDGKEQTRLGVRYPELFSFIFSSIEARLTALEAK
tara:strand:- start:36 stop:941 length:906 start_codon:yes stop_codon:yes gene_type:complete